nr:MAG TPA: hypothetical protein [Caudoviricetes sp.]
MLYFRNFGNLVSQRITLCYTLRVGPMSRKSTN